MLPLKYPRRWRIAGSLLLLGVLAAAMAPAMLPWHGSSAVSIFWLSDKWLHGLTFALLAIWYTGQYTRSTYWIIAAGLLLFGALIEFCQSLVTYRSAEMADFLADALGIGGGMLIALLGFGGWSLRTEAWMNQKFG